MNDLGREFIEGAARAMFEELTDVAPDTPDYVRLEAARLLGKLEQANGVTVTAIMHAAAVADMPEQERLAMRNDAVAAVQLNGDEARDFGHYIAMQAMGHGVSWFDDHAEFDLPTRAADVNLCANCEGHVADEVHAPLRYCGTVHGGHTRADHHEFVQRRSKFVVPSIEFTAYDLED